jgi:hypothetical protein
MATFVNFFDQTLINLDHVKEVRVHWHKDLDQRKTTVIFTDGTVDSFRGIHTKKIETAAPHVPAGPGFYLMAFSFYDAEPNVADILALHNREPIVAWRLDGYGPSPVVLDPFGLDPFGTVDGVSDAILRPDGAVELPCDRTFKDINEWAADVCSEWAK